MSTDLLDPSHASANTIKIENTDKRDTLVAIEKKYQAKWQADKVFEANVPSTGENKRGKHFVTFAYPYMNGTLHMGHGFTASKVELSAGFARLQGKDVLFPLGFHCTGMPIKACADKLINEQKKFGKNFEGYNEEESEPVANGSAAPPVVKAKEDPTKFSSTKGKAANKAVALKYQFQIMRALGIPNEEISKFADTNYWLEYFPPLCMRDMNGIGARVDWRRQMITTDANPYYDAFVRWQMRRLYESKKILYGNRYTIYSPKDGQPCMDHDRAEGEGVGPTEYTALKLQVKEWSPEARSIIGDKIPQDAKVYFVPATLRPETMYGQVCCFVGPKIEYGIFKVSERVYYVVTKRAAWNMAFQGTFFKEGHFPSDESELQPVVLMPGSKFVGTLINAPLSFHPEGVRILPMESVSATKGTGVVTCVPSDSPDDYATVKDLAKKADYYKIKKEWAELEILPLIETPKYGNLAAKFLVEKMKINSPKDVTQLAEAKDLAYKAGFYEGTMLVGDFKGQKVSDAKEKVRKSLIDSGDAIPFADPSGKVISRSADECVVAFLGQWFLNYGEQDKEWQQTVINYVKDPQGLNCFVQETANGFVENLEWLNRWACARTYGLGSKLPWDPKFLVESLSDSTIYMSYYTISHFLHSDRYGRTPGRLDIKPEQMIDEIWDAIFGRTEITAEVSQKSGISEEKLRTMRQSFEYWYPLDVRVSGKDLIPNHLTFFLYVHIALFPRKYWPRAVRSNGHLLLNGKKMSKSTGNFLTLSEATQKFGADATRIALADAGDGIDDANFEESSANRAILRMHTLKEWIEEQMKNPDLRSDSSNFWDALFLDEMHTLTREAYTHYAATNYKLALKSSLYDFQAARDFYREACTASDIPMSKSVITTYVELQALLITTIAPHWAEYMWLEVLHKPTTIQRALWPEVPAPDPVLAAMRDYIKTTSSNITSSEAQASKKMAKGKTAAFDPKKDKKITIFAAKEWPAWQEKYVELVRGLLESSSLDDAKKVNEGVKSLAKGPEMKKAMPFVQELKKKLVEGADKEKVFDRKLAFDEVATLRQMKAGIVKTTGAKDVEIISAEGQSGLPGQAETAVPGQPGIMFENV